MKAKKKILFVMHSLEYGGIPAALLALLREIQYDYNIDLLVFYPEGSCSADIPENIRMIPAGGLLPLLGIRQAELAKKSFSKAVLRAGLVGASRVAGNRLARDMVFLTAGRLRFYDAAISFEQDNAGNSFAIGCNDFVIKRVSAAMKITFVHCDFLKNGCNDRATREAYRRFDRIACVSHSARDAFLKAMPDLEKRTLVVENCTDYARIRDRAGDDVTIPKSLTGRGLKLISVSRIVAQKAHVRAIRAVAPLMREHPDVTWTIVGDGDLMQDAKDAAADERLSDRIVFIGRKDNPYPYMKRADLFFLPSRHEADPMVFKEASVLFLPVLTTDTCTAARRLDGNGGFVCENSGEGIRAALKELLENPGRIRKQREKLEKRKDDNGMQLAQWRELIR